MAREVSQVTWYQHAREFMDARWPRHAAKGRVSLAEGLTAVTAVPVKNQRGASRGGIWPGQSPRLPCAGR